MSKISAAVAIEILYSSSIEDANTLKIFVKDFLKCGRVF
jgi:hypothetical protein